MLRGILIAWVVWASSFVAPAGALAAPSDGGSVDAATIAAADVAPNRPASTQRDSTGSRALFSLATVARPALDAAAKRGSGIDLFDRRAERRRVIPRRAPPRLGDDGFH